MDDIHPCFQPSRYPSDGESDSDTRLTPTVSLDSDPSEPSYPSYHMASDPSEPSHPSVIHLTSYLSSSSTAPHHAPPLFVVVGSFVPAPCPMDVSVLEEEDVAMTLPVVSEMVTSRSTVDLDSAYGVEHEDSPFLL